MSLSFSAQGTSQQAGAATRPIMVHGANLRRIARDRIPAAHPVSRFAAVYESHLSGALLPHYDDLLTDPVMITVTPWVKHIEPVELYDRVDFKVLLQGAKHVELERRAYKDQWMRDTIDSEFAEGRYNELTAASILRKPLFSKGQTATIERSYLYLFRGVFPVFADNRARLHLFLVEAETYAAIEREEGEDG